MSKLNDFISSGKIKEIINDDAGLPEHEPWGTGLASLLTLPPSVPFLKFNEPVGERRTGQDRRSSDRRVAAREFRAEESNIPEES